MADYVPSYHVQGLRRNTGRAVYGHMEREKLLLDEQKGCKRQSRGTKDQLMIDKMVKKELQKKNDRLECCLDRL